MKEMKLKLLGTKYTTRFDTRNYRGVERSPLNYHDNLDEKFFEFLSKSDEMRVLQDLEFCRELVRAYQNLNPPQEYEIIEITENNKPPAIQTATFLGFDVGCAYSYSLLAGGLNFDYIQIDTPEDSVWRTLFPVLQLVEHYFKPLLNEHGLFLDYETALFFIQVITVIQQFRPELNLWESHICKYEVLGLWKVL
ncbi:MAG: hypothetical protein HUU38_31215 [Anaerolineales bacterium]|nr:hypothetical protein [Anaerolineales bacterium]